VLNGLPWVLRKVTGDRIVPSYYGNAEPWIAPPGGIVPGWMFVLPVPALVAQLIRLVLLGNPLDVMSPDIHAHDRSSLMSPLPIRLIRLLPSITRSVHKKRRTFPRTTAQSILSKLRRGYDDMGRHAEYF
jgi:hypothetical protein